MTPEQIARLITEDPDEYQGLEDEDEFEDLDYEEDFEIDVEAACWAKYPEFMEKISRMAFSLRLNYVMSLGITNDPVEVADRRHVGPPARDRAGRSVGDVVSSGWPASGGRGRSRPGGGAGCGGRGGAEEDHGAARREPKDVRRDQQRVRSGGNSAASALAHSSTAMDR